MGGRAIQSDRLEQARGLGITRAAIIDALCGGRADPKE
jgi:hypothetical protein